MVLCTRCERHVAARGHRPSVNNPYVERGTCEMCGRQVGQPSLDEVFPDEDCADVI